MATRFFPRRIVLRYVLGATVSAFAGVGCGHEQSELVAPRSEQRAELLQGFVTIDYPGATYTSAQSISPSGEILGRYIGADGNNHGFLVLRGKFTPVPDVPGAIESSPNRLNAHGKIVGTYFDGLREHAYVLSDGMFTTIDFPDPAISLAGWGITDDGHVVGPKFVEGDFLNAHGYVFGKNTFAVVDFPGAMGTFPTAMTDNAKIAGTYVTTDFGFHGFLSSMGTFSTIDFPNSTFNWVNDVNPRGDIVGFYGDQSGVQHGFVEANGAFATIDPPGSVSTQALGINPQGDVVGYYVTTDGHAHGFVVACGASGGSACSP